MININLHPATKMVMSYYGDDFTGSTDSMEALSSQGLRTVLFMEAPKSDFVEKHFSDLDCIGVAGMSRTMSPAEMEKEIEHAYTKLKEFDTLFTHYKICSTADSSPQIGNVGTAIKTARRLLGDNHITPMLVGTPYLKRYTIFGNHFADYNDTVYRLDRHPVMSKHPVTPMHEADLRVHFMKQAELDIKLVDILQLSKPFPELYDEFQETCASNSEVILLDALSETDLSKIGEILWKYASEEEANPLFVVGSSAVQHAIVEAMKAQGRLKMSEAFPQMPVDQVFVVSGSCSPMTKEQINYAVDKGFRDLAVSVEKVIANDSSYFAELYEEICKKLNDGYSLIVHTLASSQKDDFNLAGDQKEMLAHNLGRLYAHLIKKVQENTGIKRTVIAGGDTSGYTVSELGVYALEMILPVAKGAPLCRCFNHEARVEPLELALKGGQLGQVDYFERVLNGFSLNT